MKECVHVGASDQGKWEKAGQTKKSEMALIRDDRSEGILALTATLAYGVRIHSFF